MHPARERLLDGFARRLAIARDAGAYALRGGLLVRSWMPEANRRVRDIDLVCALPYQRRDLRARLGDILGTSLDDGVRFRVDITRAALPSLTMYASGKAGGAIAEIAVDLTFELDVWPRVARRLVGDCELWTCPHEMVIGTKLAVIGELGPHAWRAKDLADVWLASRRFERTAALGEAIERGFARRSLRFDLHELLTTAWWNEPEAASRWARHLVRAPSLPFDLSAVIAEVRRFLMPFARYA
jgi:hypothetical protein